jgi:hypothetical protein
MTQRLDRLPFLIPGAFIAMIGFVALVGCASTNIEDAVPTASTDTVAEPSAQAGTSSAGGGTATAEAPAEIGLAGGPKNTGNYPNLNIKPQSANEQITLDEKAADTAALRAAQQTQTAKGAGTTTTNPALLRKLAATHTTDALKQIEGQ